MLLARTEKGPHRTAGGNRAGLDPRYCGPGAWGPRLQYANAQCAEG
jgi:hypothetical protein